MNKETLKALAREAANGNQTEQDLNEFRQMLTKVTVERALNAELDEHLGYISIGQTRRMLFAAARLGLLTHRFAKFRLL